MLSLRARSAGLAAGILVALTGPAAAAGVDPTDGPALVTDDTVVQLAREGGDRVLLRGSFSRIGRVSGPLVAIAPASGARDPNFPVFDGQISASVADGAGGVYVAGTFLHVDGLVRRGVAHVQADGRLDTGFRADVDRGAEGDGSVWALALDGPTLYLGGDFERVNGTARGRIAAVTAERGSTRPFRASVTGEVRELAVAPAAPGRPGRLFVGAGGLLGLDPASGSPLPGFSTQVVGAVRALATDGDSVWVGGAGGLTAVDAASGLPRAGFRATPSDLTGAASAGGTIHTLLLDRGRLLAGGNFTALGGAPGPLVALDPVTGSADRTFAPQVQGVRAAEPEEPSEQESGIFALARTGEQLWAGGSFTRVEGRSAPGLVALDTLSGRRAEVTPPPLDGQVNTLTPLAGRLVTGGQSVATGSVARDGLAAIDARSLRILPGFAPNDRVENVPFFDRQRFVDPFDGELIVGRDRVFTAEARFDGYAKGTRERFADQTSTVRSLDPRTGRLRGRLRVRRLTGITALDAQLVIARRLDDRRRFPRVQIDVRRARTLKRVRSFRLPLRGYVTRLATVDGKLYAAGSFRRRRANGQPANLAVVRLDPRSGRIDSSFDPHVNGPVGDLTGAGRRLFLAGSFSRAAPGVRRSGLLAAHTRTGTVNRRFRPPFGANEDTLLTFLGRTLAVTQNVASDAFLGVRTGRRASDRAGFGDALDAVAPLSPTRLVATGRYDGPLAADSFSRAGLVRVVGP